MHFRPVIRLAILATALSSLFVGCGPDTGVESGDTCCYETVSAGTFHACAVDEGGSIDCWGRNEDGQADPPGGTFVDVEAVGGTSCGLREDGDIDCWGFNSPNFDHFAEGDYRRIGDGWCDRDDDGNLDDCFGRPLDKDVIDEQLGDDTEALEVSDACLLDDAGRLHCWGTSSYDQHDPPDGHFVSLSSLVNHGCASRKDGDIVCWGGVRNIDESRPGDYRDVSTDDDYACAIEAGSDDLDCWELFPESTAPELSQTDPPAGSFETIDTGGDIGCAIDTDGYLSCWGSDEYGQLAVP